MKVVKFVQLVIENGVLYGLDDKGCIWVRVKDGRGLIWIWDKVECPYE